MNDNLGILLRSQAILNRWRNATQLAENQEVDRERKAPEKRDAIEKAEDDRRYIDQRLRDLAAFERKASGK